MIWECFFMGTLLATGWILLVTRGVRGWCQPALSFVLGSCTYVVIGLGQVVLHLPTYPVVTLAIAWVFNLSCLGSALRAGRLTRASVNGPMLAASFGGLLMVVVTLRQLNFVTWHSDSFRYAMASALIADSHFVEMSTNLLTKRMFGYPVLHAPALFIGEYYFRSLAPLLATATTWTLAWFVFEGLNTSGATQRDKWLMSLIAVGLLVSNNRFLWNSFYLNGHLLCALTLLVTVGAGWLRARGSQPRATYVLLQNLAVPVLVTTRPEGALLAAFALVPSLASAGTSKAERTLLLSNLGATCLGWHGYVMHSCLVRGDIEASSIGLCGLGAILLATAFMVHRWQAVTRWFAYLVPAAEIALWCALLAFSLVRPAVMRSSIAATLRNVGLDGASWGSSILVLSALVAATLTFTRAPDRTLLRFPVTTFIPLMLLLAPLRGEAYRVGNWDSLTRMLIHIVPLAVLLLAASASSRGHLPFRRRVRAKAVQPTMATDGLARE